MRVGLLPCLHTLNSPGTRFQHSALVTLKVLCEHCLRMVEARSLICMLSEHALIDQPGMLGFFLRFYFGEFNPL